MALLVQLPNRVLRHRAVRGLWKVPKVQQWRLYTSLVNDGTVLYLRSAKTDVEVYLVGTAHVSAKSAEEVYQVIVCISSIKNKC